MRTLYTVACMGLINWLVAAAIIASPWRSRVWPLAVLAILADPAGNTVTVADLPGAREIIERWRRYYLSKGYGRDLVNAAVGWAVETAEGYVNKVFRDLPREEKLRILREALEFYLEKAEKWMGGLRELAASTEAKLAAAPAPVPAVTRVAA